MIRRLLAIAAILIAVLVGALALFARGLIGGDTVRRTLETQLSSRVGEPVSIRSLSSSFFPRVTVDLHQVSIGRPARATIAQLSIATGLRGLLSRRVEDAEVLVSDGRFPAAMAFGIAGAAASPSLGGEAGSGLTIVSVRSLAFRHVELVAEPHSLLVDLESSLDGDRLDVTRLVAESQGTRLEAQGSLTSVARRAGAFTARAGRLNLEELLAVVSGLSGAAPATRPDSSALDLKLDLSAPGGEVGGFAFQALSSTVHVTSDQIALQPLRFEIFGGEYSGDVRISDSQKRDVTLSGRLTGMDVARILRESGHSTSVSGRMSGDLSITSRGAAIDDILHNARGSGRLTIEDGAVPGLEMVRTIVLAFGKPSGAPPLGSGSTFTSLGGAFALADRTLHSDDVTFNSRDFDMNGRVQIRLPAGAIDMRANVRLSRELTEQAGTDLRRYAQEDGRVVVPAVITGTMAAPSVSIDVGAAMQRALQNELKRKVKGLFDRIIREP
jgi:hypothetical protein